jgi:hypothetical protein
VVVVVVVMQREDRINQTAPPKRRRASKETQIGGATATATIERQFRNRQLSERWNRTKKEAFDSRSDSIGHEIYYCHPPSQQANKITDMSSPRRQQRLLALMLLERY